MAHNEGIRKSDDREKLGRMATTEGGAGYIPTPTALAFHNCMDKVRGILGPIGSGKSVACCNDIFFRCNDQTADRSGVRRSRVLIVRNTYQELVKTTVNTWVQWFPDTEMRMTPPISGRLRRPSIWNDGTWVDIELMFLALDREEQVRDLKSLEISMVWVNEASELKWEYIEMAFGRCGRYPSKKDAPEGKCFKNLGLIMDTNPPSDTSWWYDLAEVKKPKGYSFFRQPPAVLRYEEDGKIWYEPNEGQMPGVPKAENIENHNEGFEYYMRQTLSGNHDWIRVYLMAEYGTTLTGAPVYTEYNDRVNCLNEDPEPMWGLPVFGGVDFGLTPAAVILQVLPNGQIVVYDEVCADRSTVTKFCQEMLRPLLINRYRFGEGARISFFGDPAGLQLNETSDIGAIEIMNQNGIPTRPCPVKGNSFILRREAVAVALSTRLDGDKPGLVISKRCKRLRQGFLGRYQLKTKTQGADIAETKLGKDVVDNIFTHPQDALQYGVYGAMHNDGENPFNVNVRRGQMSLWQSLNQPVQQPRSQAMNLSGFF